MTDLHLPPVSRRSFLAGMGFLTLAQTLPFRLALAAAPTDRRLLLVILRGAMDGLGAVVPYSDPQYNAIRASLAVDPTSGGLVKMDSDFAFANALSPIADLYKKGEVAVLHAAATPYRERSHFDAQDLLENGSDSPHGLGTGWLNRALAALVSAKGLAIGAGIPLVLRGDANVTSWSPDYLPVVDSDFMARVMAMYDHDQTLHRALAESEMQRGQDPAARPGNTNNARAFISMMSKAASFLAQPDGARLGSIDIGGWDTHVGQSTRLPNNLKILADGLTAFRTGMGAHWNKTAVLVVTEFGRTARPNGTNGTDHGTGTVSMLLGGSVNGGRMLGDWPGLTKLYEDRDLYPANDLRSLLKSTLNQHLGIDMNRIESDIFPDSASAKAFPGLIRQS